MENEALLSGGVAAIILCQDDRLTPHLDEAEEDQVVDGVLDNIWYWVFGVWADVHYPTPDPSPIIQPTREARRLAQRAERLKGNFVPLAP